MSPSSPILVATDFSAPADAAVRRAAQLAKAGQRPLRLLYVFNPFAWEHLHRLLPIPLRGSNPRLQADLALDKRVIELGAHSGLDDVSSRVADGRAASQIDEQAESMCAGLIVIGVRGEGIAHELAIGGTAIKLLRRSPCPVLVVRNPPERPYERIVVGTDFSATAERAARVAQDEFPRVAHVLVHASAMVYEGRMRLAGATPEDIERYRADELAAARRDMDAFLVAAGYSAAPEATITVIRHGYATSLLMEELQASGADLLVLGRHGASVLDERLLGSVTLNLIHHAPCDVLVVP